MFVAGKCRLNELLHSADMTRAELSRRTGVSSGNISNYANGRSVMGLIVAKNIASVLDCNIEELYEWEILRKK